MAGRLGGFFFFPRGSRSNRIGGIRLCRRSDRRTESGEVDIDAMISKNTRYLHCACMVSRDAVHIGETFFPFAQSYCIRSGFGAERL